MQLPSDRRKEFVVSIDTAHVRSADAKAARNFEIVVARCGRGGRGDAGGRYFTTSKTGQHAIKDRALHALQREGIADHMVRSRSDLAGALPSIDSDIRAVKWRLWHGRLGRAMRELERLVAEFKTRREEGSFAVARLDDLGAQLLTYIPSNRGAIINYGKRYRAGLRVATLAESAVNSLVAKRMVKKQQMRWSQHGAHMLMQESGSLFSWMAPAWELRAPPWQSRRLSWTDGVSSRAERCRKGYRRLRLESRFQRLPGLLWLEGSAQNRSLSEICLQISDNDGVNELLDRCLLEPSVY